MTRFPLQAINAKPLLTAIALHGLTDLDEPRSIPIYAAAICAPIPCCLITPLFCIASVAHFCNDVGLLGSVAVHATVAIIGVRFGIQAAFKAMIGYLGVVHVPLHYYRCYENNRSRVVFGASVTTLLALPWSHTMPITIPFSNLIQLLIISHILVELLQMKRL